MRSALRSSLLWVALGVPALIGGCVVEDELKGEIREVVPTMKFAQLTATPAGAGHLDFTFNYQLGIRDEAGIDGIDWWYRLMTPQEVVLATHQQEMRKPEPDEIEVLVQGDRTRKLDIPRGLEDGKTYVLWVTLYYRGEIFEELLTGVVANGPPFTDEVDLDDLPDL